MTDPNLSDFYGRVTRIERARSKGLGFEATGTLGRSHYTKVKARRRSFVGPLLFLVICVFLLKGTMYNQIGASLYNERVSALRAGEGVERVGGWLMQADPVTVIVSHKIADLLARIK